MEFPTEKRVEEFSFKGKKKEKHTQNHLTICLSIFSLSHRKGTVQQQQHHHRVAVEFFIYYKFRIGKFSYFQGGVGGCFCAAGQQ